MPLIKIILFPLSIIFIKYKKFRDINGLLDFCYSLKGLIITPMQIREEIDDLLNILIKETPKIILEIGTANGGTLFLLTKISDKNAKIISIDLPNGRFGGGYKKWRTGLYHSFSKYNQSIYLLRGDSHSRKSFEEVKKILENQKLDILFIDGDHSYEGVKSDFLMYSLLVNKNGFIIFHDIVPGPSDSVGGVPDFWQSIKNNYEYKEIVKDWNQGGYGVGLIKI
jgi:predicted O-methyltransferase YrrM